MYFFFCKFKQPTFTCRVDRLLLKPSHHVRILITLLEICKILCYNEGFFFKVVFRSFAKILVGSIVKLSKAESGSSIGTIRFVQTVFNNNLKNVFLQIFPMSPKYIHRFQEKAEMCTK